jgi:histidine triad (HIT) family protein
LVTSKVANQLGVDKGYRIVINNGEEGGQTVFHLHLHLIAGFSQKESDM